MGSGGTNQPEVKKNEVPSLEEQSEALKNQESPAQEQDDPSDPKINKG